MREDDKARKALLESMKKFKNKAEALVKSKTPQP